MRKNFLLASLLALTFLCGGCGNEGDYNDNVTYIYNDANVDETDQKGIISGIVTCLESPVSGVSITYGGKTAYSMLDGTFKLRSVDLADGKVTFSKEGYFDFRTKLNVSEIMDKHVTINCELSSIATVKGSVTDTWGNALEGATVAIEGTDIKTTSLASGEYTLTGLVASDFKLTASKDGYQTVSQLIRGEWLSDGLLDSFDFACHKLGKLSGVVKDSSTSSPLSGVKVMCGSAIVYTGSDGSYLMDQIYPEEISTRDYKGFEVEYSLTGYTTKVIYIDFYAATDNAVVQNVSLVKA